jgi:DNA polymerase-3 subunit delta'
MKFSDVIGQSEIKAKLIGMVQSGKIPHALMLMGPEGNGNLALALALTQYIQCQNRTDTDSCGTCASCARNHKFIHPDVHFTFPVIKPEKQKDPPVSADFINDWRSALSSNVYMSYNDWLQGIGAENKQGNITADECRQIIHHLSLKTYEDGYKIQLIWLAEHLGHEGNILLKVLEEPPPNTIFILVVENSELVLNTILSRTQIVKTAPIADADVMEGLLARFEMDENSARRISRIVDGNFNAALNVSGGEESANDKLLHQWLLCCHNLKLKPTSTNTKNLLDWVEEAAKTGRENQKIFLKYALFFLRECSLISQTGKSEKLDGEELKVATRLSALLDADSYENLSKILSRMHYYVERNANPKILFMSNSIRISGVFAGEAMEME